MSSYNSLDEERDHFLEHVIGPLFKRLGTLCMERDSEPHTPSEMAEIWQQIADAHADVKAAMDAKVAEKTLLSAEILHMRKHIMGFLEAAINGELGDDGPIAVIEVRF